MCTCILGIFAFQGYWLYNSYRLNLEGFHKDINDALRMAVFNKQFTDAARHIRYRTSGAFPSTASVPVVPRQGMSTVVYLETHTIEDSVPGPAGVAERVIEGQLAEDIQPEKGSRVHGTPPFRKRMRTQHWTRSDSIYRRDSAQPGMIAVRAMALDDAGTRVYADSMAQSISNMLILNKFYGEQFSIQKLDSAFTGELLSRGITTDFRLDTMTFSGNDSVFVVREYQPDLLKTARIPFNPLSNILVQASFNSPMRLILGKMTGTLLSSAILLMLTVLCFLYMLRTILRQKKLSEVRNDFINNMTHELKTPIATVSAAVEAMQNFNALNDQQKTRQYLNISQQELQRLGDLVEKVLHIAAEEKEDLELFREPVDLNELIRHIIVNHRLKANKKVDFTYTMLADPVVNVDKTHLSNALNNLVDNAIKYSRDPAEITIRVARQQDTLQVSVTDNGIGIPYNYQDSIFEKFFRVPTGNLHNVKGFGLGLSYVKKIIEKHGGSIRVKSEPDRGSEFLLEIPQV